MAELLVKLVKLVISSSVSLRWVKQKKHRYGGHAHIWRTTWGYREYGPVFQYLSYEIIYKLDSNGRQVLGEDGKPIEFERKPKWVNATYTPSLRQDRKLNEREIAYWESVPEYYRTKILEKSPNYPKPPKPDPNRYYY
jgi:hypothetical protein